VRAWKNKQASNKNSRDKWYIKRHINDGWDWIWMEWENKKQLIWCMLREKCERGKSANKPHSHSSNLRQSWPIKIIFVSENSPHSRESSDIKFIIYNFFGRFSGIFWYQIYHI
jgi:hypothetical protein